MHSHDSGGGGDFSSHSSYSFHDSGSSHHNYSSYTPDTSTHHYSNPHTHTTHNTTHHHSSEVVPSTHKPRHPVARDDQTDDTNSSFDDSAKTSHHHHSSPTHTDPESTAPRHAPLDWLHQNEAAFFSSHPHHHPYHGSDCENLNETYLLAQFLLNSSILSGGSETSSSATISKKLSTDLKKNTSLDFSKIHFGLKNSEMPIDFAKYCKETRATSTQARDQAIIALNAQLVKIKQYVDAKHMTTYQGKLLTQLFVTHFIDLDKYIYQLNKLGLDPSYHHVNTPFNNMKNFAAETYQHYSESLDAVHEINQLSDRYSKCVVASVKEEVSNIDWNVGFQKGYKIQVNNNYSKTVTRKASLMWDRIVKAEEGAADYAHTKEAIHKIAMEGATKSRWVDLSDRKEQYYRIEKLTR